MRGTLLHEVQAHKLALMDLGKAIAINPSQPANFYLRGDCHLKLGNYEQALQDFNSAEMKGFQDYCALTLSRGTVKRLLKRYDGAIQDFQLTYDNLDPSDRVKFIIFFLLLFSCCFIFFQICRWEKFEFCHSLPSASLISSSIMKLLKLCNKLKLLTVVSIQTKRCYWIKNKDNIRIILSKIYSTVKELNGYSCIISHCVCIWCEVMKKQKL
jgi:tetratricopeptide (TPR) repeat protein